ncbi:MAG: cytochrome c-type biogenesis protein [Burkholderiales bacterium]
MPKVFVIVLSIASAFCAFAASPVSENAQLEKRVMALAEELRCLVCQNQTLADSHAALAIDLKNRMRELLREGKSEREVLDFMVERYGDFVLYRPPLRATTVPLWAGPFILLALGVTGLIVWLRKRKTPETEGT